VWEWATKKQLHKFSLHKVSVKSLTFSSDGQYLVSLGDQDDNYLAVWDIERGAAVAGMYILRVDIVVSSRLLLMTINFNVIGSPASKDISAQPNTVVCFSKANNKFVTAGAGPIRIWHFDPKAKKISCKDCQLGQIKRVVKSAAISPDDQWAYCGTTTGDVLQISLEHALLSRFGPQKNKVCLIEFF
jgi:WD40 repeat protein